MEFTRIYDVYYYLIHNVLHHLNLTYSSTKGLDYDDFYQIACIALWQASLTYPKPISCKKNDGFAKYSYVFIKHRLLNTLRTHKKYSYELPASTPLAPWELIADETPSPIMDYHIYQDICTHLPKPLTQKQLSYVVLHFIYGWTLTEIAEYYHVKKQTVFQWQQGALKKMKYYFIEPTD